MAVEDISGGPGHEPSGSTVVVTGWHDVLVPALATRLLHEGHRVLVPAPLLLPGRTTLQTWPHGGPAPDADHRAPEFVEHDPEDPEVPAQLSRGVHLVVHVDARPVGETLRGRSCATLVALFALRVAERNGARLVVACPAEQDQPGTVDGLVAGFRSAHPVEAVLVRVPECYGPGVPARDTGVVSRMLTQATTTGTVVVDRQDRRRHRPCFVDDVVSGLLRVAAQGVVGDGTPVRLGPAVSLSTAEVAEQVCLATGAAVRVVGLRALAEPLAPQQDEVEAAPVADGPPEVGPAEGLSRCLGAVEVTAARAVVPAPVVRRSRTG